MIQSVLAEERAITQDTETRHLVHTWQDTDVLESVDKELRPPQLQSSRLSSTLSQRRTCLDMSEAQTGRNPQRLFSLKGRAT